MSINIAKVSTNVCQILVNINCKLLTYNHTCKLLTYNHTCKVLTLYRNCKLHITILVSYYHFTTLVSYRRKCLSEPVLRSQIDFLEKVETGSRQRAGSSSNSY